MAATKPDPKPNPKPRIPRPYDYERKDRSPSSAERLAAEYAELRTRTPHGRG